MPIFVWHISGITFAPSTFIEAIACLIFITNNIILMLYGIKIVARWVFSLTGMRSL